VFGGVEAGGTKFVCAVGSGPNDVRTGQFPTSTPDITLASVIEFFKTEAGSAIEAIGIGSFGPLDLDASSRTYGHITSTPKAGWENVNIVGAIADGLQIPVKIDTDVNAAMLGEARWGAARGLPDAIYLTVGTGIGGGALVHGEVVHGLMHPEIGHLYVPHDRARDPFPGSCPFHQDCLEGLAAGPALQARWGAPAGTLPPGHPAWDLEALYLAYGLWNLTVAMSPRRILIGGGVMQQRHLFPLIRTEFARIAQRYVSRPEVLDGLDQYIQPPALGARAGVLGTLVLASQAAAQRYNEPVS